MSDSECKKYEPFFGKWWINRELENDFISQIYEISSTDQFGQVSTSVLKYIHIPTKGALDYQKSIQPSQEALKDYFWKIVERCQNRILFLEECQGRNNLVKMEEHLIVESGGTDEVGWDILVRMEQQRSLKDYFSRQSATQYDVVKMWRDIANALIFCEEQNIIHRDIRPDNIYLSEDGSFKLSEFSAAVKLKQGSIWGPERVGTEKYMAPEVNLGKKYDKTVDYYSLGCTIYSILNKNCPPFYPSNPRSEEALNANMHRIKGEKVPSLKNVSDRINYILLKSLEYKPENRYRSARELHADIDALLQAQEWELKEKFLYAEPEVPIDSATETKKGLGKGMVEWGRRLFHSGSRKARK